MRLHITLDDELVEELDGRVGARRRSGFIAAVIRAALDDQRRFDELEAAFGSISDEGHVWDPDPTAWVSIERTVDPGGAA